MLGVMLMKILKKHYVYILLLIIIILSSISYIQYKSNLNLQSRLNYIYFNNIQHLRGKLDIELDRIDSIDDWSKDDCEYMLNTSKDLQLISMQFPENSGLNECYQLLQSNLKIYSESLNNTDSIPHKLSKENIIILVNTLSTIYNDMKSTNYYYEMCKHPKIGVSKYNKDYIYPAIDKVNKNLKEIHPFL